MVKLTTGGWIGARGETRRVFFCAIRLVRRDYREESGRVDDHQPILMTEGVRPMSMWCVRPAAHARTLAPSP